MNSNRTKKLLVTAAVWLVAVMASGPLLAANWLFLQGTEPEGSADLARVWGFVQVQYQDDQSDPNPAGGYIPPKLIGPNLDSQSAFNVNRARIGVRGVAMPLDSKINYFLLLEMGNNGITAPGDSFAKATDASITFNHLKGARIRAGLKPAIDAGAPIELRVAEGYGHTLLVAGHLPATVEWLMQHRRGGAKQKPPAGDATPSRRVY